MHAGIIALHEKDYSLAYSYFYESFDTYNLPTVKKVSKALRALKLMVLAKIMNGNLDYVNGIIYGKIGKNYVGRDITVLKSIEVATRKKSVKELKEVVSDNKDSN